ncbi:cell division protein FtsA [Methyloligella sp. 2.7D]|uniref:cell division protein FtsA n=1 Tax=unclassified Methyloligella TaxID=2625955 RepID=UPI00157D0B58|nr:cell division protein FtsA [Methyloligella sp. GL2]QKP77987.1 cell division protein FtsA [Methyloligella sp. GL2]
MLDIGTSKIGCLIAKAQAAPDWLDGEPMQFGLLGFGHHRAEGMKGGMIVNLDSAEHCIRSAVDEAERMAEVTVEDVAIAVTCGRLKSDSFSASVALANGVVREDDIARILAGGWQYAARDGRTVLHALPISYDLDDNRGIHDPLGMSGERLAIDIHTVTADDVAMRNLMLCVERCHLGVSALVAAPYASALSVISQDEAELGVATIDFGAGTTTLSVFQDGHLIHVDAIAMGGYGLTTDIARSLSTPIEHAERLKTLHGSAFATPSDECEIITYPTVGDAHGHNLNQITKAQLAVMLRPRIEEILDQMRKRLAANDHAADAAQHLVLTGGGSQLTGLPELASNMFGKPARLGRPKPLLGAGDVGQGPDFSTATGLLHQWARGDDRLSSRSQQRFLGTGTGYFAWVSEWIRDNF